MFQFVTQEKDKSYYVTDLWIAKLFGIEAMNAQSLVCFLRSALANLFSKQPQNNLLLHALFPILLFLLSTTADLEQYRRVRGADPAQSKLCM